MFPFSMSPSASKEGSVVEQEIKVKAIVKTKRSLFVMPVVMSVKIAGNGLRLGVVAEFQHKT